MHVAWDILPPMAGRTGIFGGTFDPPHVGHLILAAEASAQLRLTRLLWVPAAMPPHKTDSQISPLEDRLAMLRLSLEGGTAFEISRVTSIVRVRITRLTRWNCYVRRIPGAS